MILHSIAPLTNLVPADSTPPEEALQISGGALLGRNTPDGFIISSLCSTNPADYLDGKFSPGAVYKAPTAGKSENEYRI